MIREEIKQRFELIAPFINERQKRLFAAAEALIIGHGGKSIVSRSIGMSREVIASGCKELKSKLPPTLSVALRRKTTPPDNVIRRCLSKASIGHLLSQSLVGDEHIS